MLKFYPLRVEVELKTSFNQVKANLIHLDGLLYCSIYQRCRDHESTLKELDRILSKSNGIYHASQALFVKNIKSNNNLVNQSSLQQISQPDFEAKKIIFFAHGDSKKIQDYLYSTSKTDKGVGSGFGEIEKVTVTRMVDDWSWFLDDKLNRILPTSIFINTRSEPVRSCRFQPNYKSSSMAECYVPINNTWVV